MVISHSGRNSETLQVVEELQRNDVSIIAITSYSGSPLAQAGVM
ncbi:SIS domain-containing protein [Levilactobacillus brevis]|nr:SIS domain-containing protein [Levilactobacillus brevis]